MRKLTFLVALSLAACQSFYAPAATVTSAPPPETATATASPTATQTQTPLPSATATPADPVVFAVIGDYGQAGNEEFALAEMIDSWHVDFITTVGDNNYQEGSADTIDTNIGQYFHRYIGNYKGEYNRGSEINRFFPSLGNHDWDANNTADPYLDYFTLPGNERYYDVVWENIHLFILDSDTREPDGVGKSSAQAEWFHQAISASTSEWNVVVFHHAPYSSGLHGSTDWMQWPFTEWGADVVLTGHDHLYERLEVDGIPYFINGLGGHAAIYDFQNILPESQFRYNAQHGGLRVTVTDQYMLFEFINIDGELIDTFTLPAD
jgi:hypothetical protein